MLQERTSSMSAEIWTMIGVGVGIAALDGTLFTILNVRISDLRKDMRDMREDTALMERRINDRIDSVEKNLGGRIDSVEKNLGGRIDSVEARVDGVETRLRAVEQGQARVIGAVEMMQTIVVATLRGEEVSAG